VLVTLAVAVGAVATACEPATEPAPWTVRPGVEQVTVSGATPGQPLTLYQGGTRLLTFLADPAGQAHFAYIPAEHTVLRPGPTGDIPDITGGDVLHPGTYTVRDDSKNPRPVTAPFEVLGRDDTPDVALYDGQSLRAARVDVLGNPLPGTRLEDGFQYLEMRDGVRLSAMVRFPDPGLYGPGPYPTVIEYSGYGPSNPGAEEAGIRLARTFGYATVAVNMRGTGCSGGVFDLFNPAQQADGYDIVEIVGRQPWVLGSRVGMVGLSYSGISQLYTATTRPPHLAAVLPQSVIADPWLQQWPGGVYNSGFTKAWLEERERQSSPGGTSWVANRIAGGDEVCDANQGPHALSPDFERFGRALETYVPSLEARDLRELVRDIEVPVYLTGAFQDEQTGPQFTQMVDHFDAAPVLKVGLWNGRHPDGYAPSNIIRWFEFMEFYVAGRVPKLNPLIRSLAPAVLASSFGLRDTELDPDRWFDAHGTDYAAARAAYEAEPDVRVVLESGIGANELGEAVGTTELSFDTWPAPGARKTRWYLGSDEQLTPQQPSREQGGFDAFRTDPAAGATTILEGRPYQLLAPVWDFDWTEFADGDALSYLTAPLPEDVVVAGPGFVDLHLRSDAPDVALQVSVSEVRPDGVEYLVTNGWLRAGHRAVDEERSEGLEIVHYFDEEHYRPLKPGDFVRAKVDLPSFAHAFRAGSRLRLVVATPGRNHATWEFENPAPGAINTVARTRAMPSSLVLPVLRGVEAPDVTPAPCPGLRGMACRSFRPSENRPG
jgi:predicted acyl esterase